MDTRTATWTESLSIYLDRVRDEQFKWGSWDCALFAAGAIKAQTGTDITEGFKEAYGSWREAAAWLKANNYRSFAEAVTDRLGKPVHASQAGRGDIVMRRVGNGNVLGVCVGKHAWFLGEEVTNYINGEPIIQAGLVSWPTLLCDQAWKIAPVKPEPKPRATRKKVANG